MSKYQVMRPLNSIEREKLKGSIEQYGVQQAIVVDENGNIIDGHHRRDIAQELGIECPQAIKIGLDEEAKVELAFQLNLTGRALDEDERTAAWEDMRSRGMSYRQISEADGTASKTEVHRKLTNSTVPDGTVEKHGPCTDPGVLDETPAGPTHVIGKDGKKRKARTKKGKKSTAPDKVKISQEELAKKYGLKIAGGSANATRLRKALRAAYGGPIPRSGSQEELERADAAFKQVALQEMPDKMVEEAKKEVEQATSQVPLTHKQKLTRAVTKARQLAEIEAEEKARKLIQSTFDHYLEKEAALKKQISEYQPVMTKNDFKVLLSCLHSDRIPENLQPKYNRMFDLINKNRIRLCGPDESDENELSSTLPKSVEEMLARRRVS